MESCLQCGDLLVLLLEVAKAIELTSYVFRDFLCVRIEVFAELLCQAGEILQVPEGLVKGGHLLQQRVVGVVQEA